MDHCLEFPSLVFQSYLLDRNGQVDLYGPLGTVDYSRVLSEKVYPYAPEIVHKIGKQWKVEAREVSSGVVLETEKFRVLSVPVEHGIPTSGYKIESREGTVVISGDTRPSKSLIDFAKGADLLIHECSFPDDMIELARQSNHCVASEVGEVANQAHVKKLILTHLFPSWRGREGELLTTVKSKYGSEVIASHDLLEINL
jgi:ribonuclease BN (tRNA processing enzyme)